MISRILEKKIKENLETGKVIVLLGARQTGKTTLLNNMFGNQKGILWLNGDEPEHRMLLHQNSDQL